MHFEKKHKGVNWVDYKRHNEHQTVSDIQTKISNDANERQYLSEPKMTEHISERV